ncbi:MAG: hypothetical protein FWC89_13855 [Defluviitaleaceae bacterium]|nr:hypothetical protein [Defluviitaleaceae bacterium]
MPWDKTIGCASGNRYRQPLDNRVVEEICKMNTDKIALTTQILNIKSTLALKSKEVEHELNTLKKRLSQVDAYKAYMLRAYNAIC